MDINFFADLESLPVQRMVEIDNAFQEKAGVTRTKELPNEAFGLNHHSQMNQGSKQLLNIHAKRFIAQTAKGIEAIKELSEPLFEALEHDASLLNQVQFYDNGRTLNAVLPRVVSDLIQYVEGLIKYTQLIEGKDLKEAKPIKESLKEAQDFLSTLASHIKDNEFAQKFYDSVASCLANFTTPTITEKELLEKYNFVARKEEFAEA